MRSALPSEQSGEERGELTRQFLCRVEDHFPFAYVRGQDVYRSADHILWARLSDGLLISARTARPIAYAAGRFFDDLETRAHVYYLTARPHQRALNFLERGLCGEVDHAIFEPAPEDELGERRAKQYCGQCPVRLDCLAVALTVRELPGIWGGLTHRERARRRRSATASRR